MNEDTRTTETGQTTGQDRAREERARSIDGVAIATASELTEIERQVDELDGAAYEPLGRAVDKASDAMEIASDALGCDLTTAAYLVANIALDHEALVGEVDHSLLHPAQATDESLLSREPRSATMIVCSLLREDIDDIDDGYKLGDDTLVGEVAAWLKASQHSVAVSALLDDLLPEGLAGDLEYGVSARALLRVALNTVDWARVARALKEALDQAAVDAATESED
jgi:hypothetical protein